MQTQESSTFGLIAVRLGVQAHHLDRLARRGLIPYRTTGRFRVIALADLDAVRRACEVAGFLKAEEVAAHA